MLNKKILILHLLILILILLFLDSLYLNYSSIDILYELDINNVILIIIVIYFYKSMLNMEQKLDFNVLYSKKMISKLVKDTAVVVTALATAEQARKTSINTKIKEELDKTLNENKKLEESLKEQERINYENEIQRQDLNNKNKVLEAENEELKEKLSLKKIEDLECGDSDDPSNMFTRSSNENNILDILYDYISQPLEYIANFSAIQSFALSILLFLLVLISSLFTIVIYVLNGYLIDKYNIKERYPKAYKYISIYRDISYISVLISIFLFIFCIIVIIINCIWFIING